ncbi:MAG TPA: hypothetical protein VIV60_31870 [Polyangiaceae bacterium]
MSKLASIKLPGIPGVTLHVDPTGRLNLSGTIATRDPAESIAPLFQSLHVAIMEDGLREFEIDLVALTFVNSSAIRLFVDWITWIKNAPPAAKYKAIFLTNSQITWQKTSLVVLKSLAPEIVILKQAG